MFCYKKQEMTHCWSH